MTVKVLNNSMQIVFLNWIPIPISQMLIGLRKITYSYKFYLSLGPTTIILALQQPVSMVWKLTMGLYDYDSNMVAAASGPAER